MKLKQKIASLTGAVTERKSALEKKLRQLHRQRAHIEALPVPPQVVIEARSRQLDELAAQFNRQLVIAEPKENPFELPLYNSDLLRVHVIRLVAFACDRDVVKKQIAKAILESYPREHASASDKAAQLAKLDSEIKKTNHDLVELYEEFESAGMDFIPAAETDPLIYLGIAAQTAINGAS